MLGHHCIGTMNQPQDRPSLLLDASTPCIQAGLLASGNWIKLLQMRGDATTCIPELLDKLFAEGGTKADSLGALIYCEGPGSLLGLRLAAMYIETLRALPENGELPIYAYGSLHAALHMPQALESSESIAVASPVRKGTHCALRSGEAELLTLPSAELPRLASTVFHIAQRQLPEAPEDCKALDYDLRPIAAAFDVRGGLLRKVERAEPFSPQPSEYKLWDGNRHRA